MKILPMILIILTFLSFSGWTDTAGNDSDLPHHGLPYHPPLDNLIISSATGYRLDPMGGSTEALHKGLDLAAPIGTPVYAVLPGVVAEHWLVPGWHHGKQYNGHPTFGAMIVIDHGEGLFTIYGHLSKTQVHEGNHVDAGDKIGEVGNTGISTGPHLHFELVIDPLIYLEERKTQ